MEQRDTTGMAADEVMFPTGHTITVKLFREWLDKFSDDTPIVMSKDAEGNGFSPLSDISATHYRADSTWAGEIHDQDDGEGSDDDGVAVVCLWPVN